MENSGFHRIHSSACKVWTINGIIWSFILLVIALIAYIFLKQSLILAGTGILCLYVILLHPKLEYRQWSYRITETNICYNHGIYVKRFTMIPISRIQHLELKQGPVLKHFGLSNVQIYTAGQSHEIVALKTVEAEEIIENINKLILKEYMDGKC